MLLDDGWISRRIVHLIAVCVQFQSTLRKIFYHRRRLGFGAPSRAGWCWCGRDASARGRAGVQSMVADRPMDWAAIRPEEPIASKTQCPRPTKGHRGNVGLQRCVLLGQAISGFNRQNPSSHQFRLRHRNLQPASFSSFLSINPGVFHSLPNSRKFACGRRMSQVCAIF